MRARWHGKSASILDFDIECRPLSYLGSDYTTAEITAVSAAWIVKGKRRDQQTWCLGDYTGREICEGFLDLYEQADMVTGHFIRGFDLPVLNGAMLDAGLPPLPDKLAHDTKNDLKKRKYMSASQENLGALLFDQLVKEGLTARQLAPWKDLANKVQMNTPLWREANRLTDEGIALTEERVEGDVRQHILLRKRLIQLDWLDVPKQWRSSGSLTGAYTP